MAAPAVNLKDAAEPAYEVWHYAWSAELVLSILTQFEEFAGLRQGVKRGSCRCDPSVIVISSGSARRITSVEMLANSLGSSLCSPPP